MNSKTNRQTVLESQFQYFDKLIGLDTDLQQQMLAEIGANDPQMRDELERMLSFHLKPETDFLEPKTSPQPSVEVLPQGQMVGNYKILQLIDEGGMGQVYMAEQQQGVRRRVALKLIRIQQNSKNFAVRFEAERQALSRLDHPNIARIIDSGQTSETFGDRQRTLSETFGDRQRTLRKSIISELQYPRLKSRTTGI